MEWVSQFHFTSQNGALPEIDAWMNDVHRTYPTACLVWPIHCSEMVECTDILFSNIGLLSHKMTQSEQHIFEHFSKSSLERQICLNEVTIQLLEHKF